MVQWRSSVFQRNILHPFSHRPMDTDLVRVPTVPSLGTHQPWACLSFPFSPQYSCFSYPPMFPYVYKLPFPGCSLVLLPLYPVFWLCFSERANGNRWVGLQVLLAYKIMCSSACSLFHRDLLLQSWRWRWYVSLKCQLTSIELHSFISQKVESSDQFCSALSPPPPSRSSHHGGPCSIPS